MHVEVTLLDGSLFKVDVDSKCTGDDLLVRVAEHLSLLEKDYFGFLFVDSRDKMLTWLHGDRKLGKQLKHDNKCIFQVEIRFCFDVW